MTKMTPSALSGAPLTQMTVTPAANKAADGRRNKRQGLYDPRNEHDACGVGFIAHMKGEKSHQIVKDGLFILENLTHRGAVGADPLMGDGAGMLMQIPDRFFREEMAAEGIVLPKVGEYAVGYFFMPRDPERIAHYKDIIQKVIADEGQRFIGFREVPVDNSSLSKAEDIAVRTRPRTENRRGPGDMNRGLIRREAMGCPRR